MDGALLMLREVPTRDGRPTLPRWLRRVMDAEDHLPLLLRKQRREKARKRLAELSEGTPEDAV